MPNKIDTIITNSLYVKKTTIADKLPDLLVLIEKAINMNKDIISEASNIDFENNNGFILDFNVISNIFKNLKAEKNIYGTVILSQKSKEKHIIYGKQIMDCGNVIVINDGNPYVIIELALRNLLAANTTIFANSGYMSGTNNLIIEIIQSVLTKNELSPHYLQLYIDEDCTNILSNYANIDLVICVGNHSLQQKVLSKSKNRVIISGYEQFDLYIEDKSNIDFINKILNTGLNFQLYIKDNLDIDYPNAILVSDIDEAIAQINYNGSKYSTGIFTNSEDSATKFIHEVKSHMITINTTPSIERIIDINQFDLSIVKTIIYPDNFQTNEQYNLEFSINENNL